MTWITLRNLSRKSSNNSCPNQTSCEAVAHLGLTRACVHTLQSTQAKHTGLSCRQTRDKKMFNWIYIIESWKVSILGEYSDLLYYTQRLPSKHLELNDPSGMPQVWLSHGQSPPVKCLTLYIFFHLIVILASHIKHINLLSLRGVKLNLEPKPLRALCPLDPKASCSTLRLDNDISTLQDRQNCTLLDSRWPLKTWSKLCVLLANHSILLEMVIVL